MSYLKSFSALCMVALPVALLGCAGAVDSQDGSENIGEAAAALTCADVTTGVYSAALIMGDVGGSVFQTSPNTSYGTTGCVGRYVVEATSTNGKPNLSAQADFPGSLPATSAACTSSTLRVATVMYGYTASTGVWDTISVPTASPVWNAGIFGGPGYCSLSAGKVVANTYSKVRVASKVYDSVTGALSLVENSINAHY
jgi:hypothetical protein